MRSCKGVGLFGKFLFFTIVTIVLVIVITTGIAIKQQGTSLTSSLIQRNISLASVVSSQIEAGYISQRWPFETLKKISENEAVLYWWIVEPSGQVHLASSPDIWGKTITNSAVVTRELLVKDDLLPETSEKIKVIVNPLKIEGEGTPWTFWLGLSLRPIAAAKKRIILTNVEIGLLAIAVGVFLSFLLARSITRPVKSLVNGTKAIAKGDIGHQISITTKDELGELASSFNAMSADLKRSHEALARQAQELARSNVELEQFAYVASHDLQEPLRMVGSFVQLLARRYQGKLDSDADEFIAYAVDGATRMQKLINDLLSYSRVTTHGKDFEAIDSAAVLDRALRSLQAAVEESDAVVTYNPMPTVMADSLQLEQLFQNLLNNAIKFRSDEPPRVHVSAERIENSKICIPHSEIETGWVFSVRDSGIGIDPEYADRIFVIFQRLHTREEYPGTGIGLALCKKIVERHGGRIWVESQPGKGATFYFIMPMKEDKEL